MIRRRAGAPPEAESSSDEEDAFSALSSSKGKTGQAESKPRDKPAFSATTTNKDADETTTALLPTSTTSSMKRHHGSSDTRKAKMDALLQELEAEKISTRSRQHHNFVPEKKGSFVQPGEEHLTTNIFVGNLAPSITEEQMTDLFRQFGDLYSLKIMWPRTPEERARNRNTGFVCFMRREDAEDAMEACSEADPFNVGRRLMMRWGKNVKMDVKRGTGGITPFATKSGDAKRQRVGEPSFSPSSERHEARSSYDPAIHGSDAIRVVAPKDPERARFITTVASFVAKDGSTFERRLIEKEAGNPAFDFLTFRSTNERQRDEHLFYKWRVYAFCQGDGFTKWRTEPFVMIKPSGKYWVPPQLDRAAAMREERAEEEREQTIRQQKAQRRRRMGRKEYMTGRQLEQAKRRRGPRGAADGGARLTDREYAEFNSLVREKLCASREAICQAMAFCFEKSGAAKQISEMLKELLLDDEVSVDTRTARLYLLSDILYNSQQPGVRNAFLYRDAIERMAPDVFASLGKHGADGKVGRMTLLKLKTAVDSVLSAWTNWSVYNPKFIFELEARFEGKELPAEEKGDKQNEPEEESKQDSKDEAAQGEPRQASVAIETPQGDWAEVSEEPVESEKTGDGESGKEADSTKHSLHDVQEDKEDVDNVDGQPLEDDDLDGESLDDEDEIIYGGDDNGNDGVDQAGTTQAEDDLDGEALGSESLHSETLDGEPLDDDVEGRP